MQVLFISTSYFRNGDLRIKIVISNIVSKEIVCSYWEVVMEKWAVFFILHHKNTTAKNTAPLPHTSRRESLHWQLFNVGLNFCVHVSETGFGYKTSWLWCRNQEVIWCTWQREGCAGCRILLVYVAMNWPYCGLCWVHSSAHLCLEWTSEIQYRVSRNCSQKGHHSPQPCLVMTPPSAVCCQHFLADFDGCTILRRWYLIGGGRCE